MTNSGIVITSKWIYPVVGAPVLQGAIVIREKRIEALGARDALLQQFKSYEHRDYGDAIVTPGLINLHSHLDYTALGPLETNAPLFEWIPLLMRSVAKWQPADFFQSALYGARLNALAGTTLIVDSSYSGQSAEAISHAGLKGVIGLELFGLDKKTYALPWRNWLERLAKLEDQGSRELRNAIAEKRIILTCSPHAPYTVCPPLFAEAKKWAEEKQRPLLSHLAESPDECGWLQGGSEVIDAYLKKVMPSTPERDTDALLESIDWKKEKASPVKFLEAHGLLSNRLVAAHSIHVDETDMQVLKTAGVSIAHCPRSNARLRNGRAPFSAYLKAGVNAGLGTDGLPSTDNLDLIAEANFALNMHRAAEPQTKLSAEDLIEAMTMGSARAIGMADKIGSLEKGKQADIAVFKIEPQVAEFIPAVAVQFADDVANPADMLIRFPTRVEAVYVDGETVVEGGRLRNLRTYASQ